MLALVGILLMVILCPPHALGQKNRVREEPIDKIGSQANFNLDKFAGKWYLLSVASECNYLKVNNHRVEATTIQASQATKPQKSDNLSVHTLRKMDGICWEIRQNYLKNKMNGRYILNAPGPVKTHMVVGETDYDRYAILYYQTQRKINLKLYGRTTTVANEIYQKFDELAAKQGIELHYIYPFPMYGFCEKADQFHILDESS
ncbi:complement component C8 gamma chain [Pelodytes ibericus]